MNYEATLLLFPSQIFSVICFSFYGSLCGILQPAYKDNLIDFFFLYDRFESYTFKGK